MKRYIIFFFLIESLALSGQRQHMLFQKTWGSTGEMFFNHIIFADQLSNGDYFMEGSATINFSGDRYYYACRSDSTGNIIWEQSWGGADLSNQVTQVVKWHDGTYYMVGTGGMGSGVGAVSFSNIDENGNVRFCRYYYFSSSDMGLAIHSTSDSCFVICGIKNQGLSSQCPILLKIDSYGNEIWRRTQSSLIDYTPTEIWETTDSGFIVLGQRSGNDNCYYAKYDYSGMMSWVKFPFGVSDTFPDRPGVLRTNFDGTFDIYYHITQLTGNPPSPVHGVLAHYNLQGDTICTTTYNDEVWKVFSDDLDSTLYAVAMDQDLLLMESNGTYTPLTIGASGWIESYILTRDGGYLGVGQRETAGFIYCDQFDMEKFGNDGRNDPQTLSSSLIIYPNPCFDGNTTLSFDLLTDENVQIRVLGMDGRLVYYDEISCPANSHTELPIHFDAATTTAGMYILEVKTSIEYRRERIIVARNPD